MQIKNNIRINSTVIDMLAKIELTANEVEVYTGEGTFLVQCIYTIRNGKVLLKAALTTFKVDEHIISIIEEKIKKIQKHNLINYN